MLASEYKTQFSAWTFPAEDAQALQGREAAVTTAFPQLDQLSMAKTAVLQDNLEKEKFREKLRQVWFCCLTCNC